MALVPLATAADLTARGIDTSNTDQVTAFLDAASSAVRDAAGSPIASATSTVVLPGVREQKLRLPGGPVTAVTSVLLDGAAVTDWKRAGESIWRWCGWLRRPCEPSEVTVTYTHGLGTVPPDIVDLVCSLVGLAVATAADGYEARGDVTSARIDDAQETYATGLDALSGPFELPQGTRDRLAARFGGGGYVVRPR